MAAEQGAETATEAAQTGDQQEETPTAARPQAGTKTEYSTCLVRTHRSLLLDVESARFHPMARLRRQPLGVGRDQVPACRLYQRLLRKTGAGAPRHLLHHLHPPGAPELLPEAHP